MKKVFALLVLLSLSYLVHAKEQKILTMGNSFAESVFRDLPRIVKSVPGCKLVLQRANLGGCSLERHCVEIDKCEKNPNYKPYPRKHKSLKELLSMDKWDIVTMQQVSIKSFRPETFEPYLKRLIEYVHQYAPQAEIVLHMTWSYHPSHKLYQGDSVKSPDEMFRKIRQTYAFYGKKYNLRIIPAGLGIQFARESMKNDKEEVISDLTQYIYPDAPKSPVYLVNIASWSRPDKNGNRKLKFDRIHLNNEGRYLQSCLWFAALYGKPTSVIKYVPHGMSAKQAQFLREMAQKAVDEYVQPRNN